jgi:hypothetical protein
MTITAATMRRLAFIKYLYSTAESQAQAPDLLSAPAVLTLHDAVEMFLLLACEHRNAPLPKRPNFEDYWPPLCAATRVEQLPEQTAMRRLNTARVALKHHGHIPVAADVDGYRHTVASFFEASTKLVFDIDFQQISMAEFIEPASARLAYEKSAHLFEEGELKEAAEVLAVAFEQMMAHYLALSMPAEGRSVFDFSRHRRFLRTSLASTTDVEKAVAMEDDMRHVLGPIRDALRILALGLDFRKYARFISLMPTVYNPGNSRPQVRWFGNVQQALTAPYMRFCLTYMVECALRLGSFASPE